MDLLIDYLFGTGEGELTRWSSPADLDVDHDGTYDAVRLDFDGDQRVDDALWDLDGDGQADVAVLDVAGRDGGALDHDEADETAHFYRDSGRGLWDVAVEPATLPLGHTNAVPAPLPSPAPPAPERAEALDLDGDGRNDAVISGRRLRIDTDGDGTADIELVDTDGDGRADVSYGADAPEFGRR
ncbi:MAG: FG-GAP-like repeat-containing protein [Gordonia sp. (in: high G+C Gram-positive bacteria)]